MNPGFLWAGIPVALFVWLAGAPGWATVGFGMVAGIVGNLHWEFLWFVDMWKNADLRQRDPQLWLQVTKDKEATNGGK